MTRRHLRFAGLKAAGLLLVAISACTRFVGLGQLPPSDSLDDAGKRGDAATVEASDAAPRRDLSTISCTRPPWPASTSTVTIGPSTARDLPRVVSTATSGTTILLEDGVYTADSDSTPLRLIFTTPAVTLRSASGDPAAVILDGEYLTDILLEIAASDVTIADISLRRASQQLVHISGNDTTQQTITGTRLSNLRLADAGQQLIKVNPSFDNFYADQGILECSTVTLTADGRDHVAASAGPCLSGGFDATGARGWIVRDSLFRGVYCESGPALGHAIAFRGGSRDSLVERNVIVDCYRGIGFGLSDTGPGRFYADDPGLGFIDHLDGIIRNNVIHAGPNAPDTVYNTGISLAQAYGTIVAHNTAIVPSFSSIDYRFSNTDVVIRNNLVWNLTQRDGARGTVDHNLENASPELFVNAAALDYHLRNSATAAIDQGLSLPQVTDDIDGAPRSDPPDLGADELN